MDGFKEFQGSNLDDAIREACLYFDTTRERLEIEIVQDSKSGIFGLVGARKAKVHARRVQLRSTVDNVLERLREAAPEPEPPQAPAPPEGPKREAPPRPQAAPPRKREKALPKEAGHNRRPSPKARAEKRPPVPADAVAAPPQPVMTYLDDSPPDEDSEGLQFVPLDSLDPDRLRALSEEVVLRLVRPIVGEARVRVAIEEGRVCAHVDSGDDSGLLIGREGQTLASIQYLASRMVSRGMNAVVRVQLDAGEYRLRQDEKLRDMALALAARVRANGRPQSTRPLSSYHRRIIHILFQDDPQVQTRSSGEGPLKRVVVQRRKG